MELNLVFSLKNEVSFEALMYISKKFKIDINKNIILYLREKEGILTLCDSSIYQYKLNIVIINESLHEYNQPKNDLINILFSTHRSESNAQTLSVHTIGNFSNKPIMAPFVNYFGGYDIYWMNWLFLMMNYNYIKSNMSFKNEKLRNRILDSTLYGNSNLINQKSERFNSDIVFEATHHGPRNPNKIIFYEIGSTINEWHDQNRIKFYVENFFLSLMKYEDFINYVQEQREGFFNEKDVLINTDFDSFKFDKVNDSFFESKYNPFFKVIVLGGNHYCSEINKLVIKNKILVGPVISKPSLDELNFDLLDKEFKENDYDFILVDEKGLGKEKQYVFDNLKKRYKYCYNQGYLKLKDLKKIKLTDIRTKS